jgi:hypothetical protein
LPLVVHPRRLNTLMLLSPHPIVSTPTTIMTVRVVVMVVAMAATTVVVEMEEATITTRLLPGLRLVLGDRHGVVHGVLPVPATRPWDPWSSSPSASAYLGYF